MKLSRQVYTIEFKEEAVKRLKSSERIASVVKACYDFTLPSLEAAQ